MIYAYDQYTPLPVQSIYDTQMMLASIGAAKDMYEKGLQEMKDFKNEYGNFLSPIAKDIEWYDKNVTGKVRDAINTMYANGIDPIRSAEGRAALSRIINQIDPAAVNFRKQRAANALAMQKNIDDLKAKGLYNEAFSNSLGENPNNWAEDFIGTTSATPYMDYEQKYGHLFDKMGFEYDEEESKKHPGMIVMTKNKDRMRNILSSNRQDLTNDRQYQYDLNNMAAQIAAANPNMSPQDVVKQATTALENEIVERNYKGGMQIEQDPIYMENLRYKHNLSVKRTPSGGRTTNPNQQNQNGWTHRQKVGVSVNFNKIGENILKSNPTAVKLYAAMQTIPTLSDKKTALYLFAGSTTPEEAVPGVPAKRLPISFADNQLQLTANEYHRYKEKFIDTPESRKRPQYGMDLANDMEVYNFREFLRTNHVAGFVPSSYASVNYDGEQYGINSYVRVPKDQVDGYFKEHSLNKVGRLAGLVIVEHGGKRYPVKDQTRKQLNWENIQYIDIPTTRVIPDEGYASSQIDTFHDSYTLGKSTASKREGEYEERDESEE